MQLSRILSICGLAWACSGCAYLTTYKRDIDLNGGSVSLDVKQRVVFSQRVGSGKDAATVVCAEPSPDALTVLGASGSLSMSNSDRVANAAAGLAESGAFVGLRTQSIQLLRDAMYRLCEGYAGGAVSQANFEAMQRRYQSTMMGLIAIEQLTRPVVAGQALLTSAAGSQSGASAGDAAVDKAQAQIKTTTDATLAAKAESDKAVAREDKAQKDAQLLRTQIATEKAKKPPDETVLAGLNDKLPAAEREASDAKLALIDTRRREQSAEDQLRLAQNALRDAQAKVTSNASAGGSLGAVAQASAQSTEYLTRGVVDIVSEINTSYTKDACITLMVELAKPSSTRQTMGDKVSVTLETSLKVCQGILEVTLTRLQEQQSSRQSAPR